MGTVENYLEKLQQNNIFQSCKSLHFPKLTVVQRLDVKTVCPSNDSRIKVYIVQFGMRTVLWRIYVSLKYYLLQKLTQRIPTNENSRSIRTNDYG